MSSDSRSATSAIRPGSPAPTRTGAGSTAGPAARLVPWPAGTRRRDVVVDIAVVVLACAIGLVAIDPRSVDLQALPAGWISLELVVAPLSALSLVWRRRFPVPVAVAQVIIGGFFLTAGVTALIAVYTVAVHRRFRVAGLLTLAHLAIAIPYLLIMPVMTMPFAVWVVVMVLLYTTALSLGVAVRARRQVILGLREAAARDRMSYEDKLSRIRRDERTRIAREMHDVLAHRLSLLSVHAGALQYRATKTGTTRDPIPDEDLAEATGVIRATAHQALEELREVLLVLESDAAVGGTGRPQPTIADLTALVAEAQAAGQRVELIIPDPGATDRLRPPVQRAVYRVVQEGLTNARKHAPGTTALVTLTPSEESLEVEVRSALAVATTASGIPNAGVGLIGLGERVRLEGGELQAGVDQGDFVLRSSLPWTP